MSFSSLPMLLAIVCSYYLTAHSGSTEAAIYWTGDWAFGCDFPGNDIAQVRTRGEICGPKCALTPECSHFVWSPSKGGTCSLKKGPISKSQAKSISDMSRVCGVNAKALPNHKSSPRSPEITRRRSEYGFMVKTMSHSVDDAPVSHCLSSKQLNEYLVTINKDVETMKKHAERIKQHMITENAILSSIKKLTTVLQQLQQQQQDGAAGTNTPYHIANNSTTPMFIFTPPNKIWCPWRKNCTQALDQQGRMTIELDQKESLAFELHVSVSADPTDTTYVIHLSINRHQVELAKTVNGITTIINQTTNEEYILQEGQGKYWLSIDYQNLFVKYGQGEVRDLCTLLKGDLPNSEQQSVRNIKYVHITFNNRTNITDMKNYADKIRLKVGKNTVARDPALIVVSPDRLSWDHNEDNTAISVLRLPGRCPTLYHDIIVWQMQDDKFPNLYQAIENSLRNESGWCYRRLREKAGEFGKPNVRATYLRITIGTNRGTHPGVPNVLEIWPPGHYSPIHAHANAYGIMRVLYGQVNVKLYRALKVNKTKPIHETIIKENQVTWLSPGLNQIHKLENTSPNKTCITIAAYEYGSEDISNYEYFDYITNDGKKIAAFDPISDMDYFKFKELMMDEWNKSV